MARVIVSATGRATASTTSRMSGAAGAGTGGGGGTATLLHSFTLTNTSASSMAVTFVRQGIPFKKGDVPAGTAVQIKRGATTIGGVQFDERSTWTDGSLKHAVMHLRDSGFAGSEARTYDVWSAPATSFDNTGTATLSDITGAHDFQVTFAPLKETATEDGSDTDLATVGSGSFTASFNTHAAVATRTEKHHTGSVCEGWCIWGMATDNTGGAADAHIKTCWYVDIWKNAAGTIYGYEVGAVVTQDWWSIAGKKRRNYNAALKDGSTTIQTYTGLRHPYHSQWLTAQTTGLARGKRFWVGGAQPTLNYAVDKTYWRDTKLIPPYDTTYAPLDYASHGGTNSLGTATYIPLSPQCHRYNFNDVGAYEGRGMLTNGDAVAFMRQTASDTACARLSALAGLHAPFHRRSNRTRTRPGDGSADTANTVCSLKLDISGNDGQFGTLIPMPSDNFTAQGMPTPVHAYSFWPGREFNGTDVRDGFVDPLGIMWPYFSSGNNSSHRPNYSYYMYLVEGERHMLESVLDLGMAATQDGGAGYEDSFMYNLPLTYGTNLPAWNEARPSGEKADPRFLTGPFCAWPFRGEERDFNPAVLGSAIGIVPDAHVAHGFFKRWQLSLDKGMEAMLYCLPPDFLASGSPPYNHAERASTMDPWMSAMTCLGHFHAAAVTESASQLAFANHYAKQAIGLMTDQPKIISGSGSPAAWLMTSKTEVWHSTGNLYFPPGKNAAMNINLYASDFVPGQAGQLFRAGSGMNAGDKIYWMSRDFGNNHQNTDTPATAPGGITSGQPLYIKSKSGVSGIDAILVCSLTPGGPDFVWTTAATPGGSNVGNCWAFYGPSNSWANVTPGQGTGGDSYGSMLRAVLIHAKALGNSAATQELVDRATTILDTAGYPTYVAWMYA